MLKQLIAIVDEFVRLASNQKEKLLEMARQMTEQTPLDFRVTEIDALTENDIHALLVWLDAYLEGKEGPLPSAFAIKKIFRELKDGTSVGKSISGQKVHYGTVNSIVSSFTLGEHFIGIYETPIELLRYSRPFIMGTFITSPSGITYERNDYNETYGGPIWEPFTNPILDKFYFAPENHAEQNIAINNALARISELTENQEIQEEIED